MTALLQYAFASDTAFVGRIMAIILFAALLVFSVTVWVMRDKRGWFYHLNEWLVERRARKLVERVRRERDER
ncbi:MAG: hypothetical protein ABL932_04185 [Terricaulis sp.]